MRLLLILAYKNMHSRAIIVPPSVHVDPLWQVWTYVVRDNYCWARRTLFDSYDEDQLRGIIGAHTRANLNVNRRRQGRGKRNLLCMCILFHDMNGNSRFHNDHGLIAEICVRRLHNYIQAVCRARNVAP